MKTSCARALLHVSKNKSWLSKYPAHTLSASPSTSPPSLSLCLLLSAREIGGWGGGHSWQLPKMDPKWCTSAHIAIWHTAGAGGGRHFWICQLIGTARFLSNSRSCTSPWWLRCNRRSCVGLEKQRCEAAGLFLPPRCITVYKSGHNPVLLPQHPFSCLVCPKYLCQF